MTKRIKVASGGSIFGFGGLDYWIRGSEWAVFTFDLRSKDAVFVPHLFFRFR